MIRRKLGKQGGIEVIDYFKIAQRPVVGICDSADKRDNVADRVL